MTILSTAGRQHRRARDDFSLRMLRPDLRGDGHPWRQGCSLRTRKRKSQGNQILTGSGKMKITIEFNPAPEDSPDRRGTQLHAE